MGSRFQLYLEPMLSTVVEKHVIARQLYLKTRDVATYTQKRICVHIWTKHTILMDYWCYVYKTCAQNQYPILTEFLMMFVSPPHRHPPINAIIIYHYQEFVYLGKQQIAKTLMRRRVLRRLIWVYAAFMWFFFTCIQPVPCVLRILDYCRTSQE